MSSSDPEDIVVKDENLSVAERVYLKCAMQKEASAYRTFLLSLKGCACAAAAATTPDEHIAELNRQVLLLREIHKGYASTGTTSDNMLKQLTQLIPVGTNSVDAMRAWLVWLNEMLTNHIGKFKGDEVTVLELEALPLLDWLLLQLQQQKVKENVAHTLRCVLSLLITQPAGESNKYWPRLMAIPQPSDVEAAMLLAHCLNIIRAPTAPLNDSDIAQCNALLQQHYDGHWLQCPITENVIYMLKEQLRLLYKVVLLHNPYAENHAPELLGFALANLNYGSCSGTDKDMEQALNLRVPRRVQPAQQTAFYEHVTDANGSVSRSGRQNKERKVRSLAKTRSNAAIADQGPTNLSSNREQLLLLGASETSDSDNNIPNAHHSINCYLPAHFMLQSRRSLACRVREFALKLLGGVCKQLPRRALYGYWHVLFPSATSTAHLLHIGRSDSSADCRALALQLAARLLYGSKSFLSQASSSGPSNYMSFARSLATSLLNAYLTLTSILSNETEPLVLMQCLKCLAALVQATPFEQLEMGFVYEFVKQVKKMTCHTDVQVQISALLVMEMFISKPQMTQEMAAVVGLPYAECLKSKMGFAIMDPHLQQELEFSQLCHDSDAEEEMEQEQNDELLEPLKDDILAKPEVKLIKPAMIDSIKHAPEPIPRNNWMLRYVLRFLESPGNNSTAALRVESLQVLLAMATHFTLLRAHLLRISQMLAGRLTDSSPDVRLYVARCIDSLAFQMAQHVLQQPEQLRLQHVAFWQCLVPLLYVAYEDASASLKIAICDALSNIGVYSFERMAAAQRNGLLAFLSGCSSADDEEPLVRAAALRALAVYLLFPTLRMDLVFVENTAELTLRLITHKLMTVRIKASWSLGNISDALLAPLAPQPPICMTAMPAPEERISNELLQRLIVSTKHACDDHDKVRANAMRALGNLLRMLSATQLQANGTRELVRQAIAKLIDGVRAAGNAKVKWNACYALGSLVRNRALLSSNSSTATMLFPILCQLMVRHSNFKVRTHATAVLLHVEERADFGSYYGLIWRSLLEAVVNSNMLDSFEEYNHRDNLQQQLCLALAHLLGCALPEDLPSCRYALEEQSDQVCSTWRRVANRMVPEQAAPFFTCAPLLRQRITSLSCNNNNVANALAYIVDALQLDNV